MKIRSKIIIVIAVTASVIIGLFALKAYYGNKLGIFADALTEEQVIFSKNASENDFVADSVTNMEQNSDGNYQIISSPQLVCGGDDSSQENASIPASATMTIDTSAVIESPQNEINITSFNNNYTIGNEDVVGVNEKTISLIPAGDNLDARPDGMLISRGNRFVEFRLSESNQAGYHYAFVGSVTFSDEISLNNSSLSYTTGGNGVEMPLDGGFDFSSNNDELTLDVENNTINFHLVTSSADDTFRINYCFYENLLVEGSVAGRIDLGVMKPITSLKAVVENFQSERDNIRISSQISKDGAEWINAGTVNNTKIRYQDNSPVDNYCFRYIQYNIAFNSESSANSPLIFDGLEVYGGDTCGSAVGFDPGNVNTLNTVCSNSIDDDGDGKIDYATDGSGDPGCTSYMDDDENNAEKICHNGEYENISLYINITDHQDENQNDLSGEIYVGAETRPVSSGAIIPLVTGGVAVKDLGIQDAIEGLSVYRGEGYFYLHNQTEGLGREAISGDFNISGANVIKAINRNYEKPSNGVEGFGDPLDDEFLVMEPDALNSGRFVTTTSDESDGFYIYYDYQAKIGGGCQCQDEIDNDDNGKIDFPQDLGCDSVFDNEEAPSDYQLTVYPACNNGLDDDGDGFIDYPEDPGCESVMDNNEAEKNKVCQLSGPEVTMRFSDVEISNTRQGDLQDLYFVGDQVYTSEEDITLAADGLAKIDNEINKFVPGVSIKRGPGYVYLLFLNDAEAPGYEYFNGKLTIEGAKITKALNGNPRISNLSPFFIGGGFESQGDNIADYTGHYALQDEFTVYNEDGKNYVEITSTTGSGSDSLYVYYEFTDAITGGCQCQDGLDNDGDGLVDYPNDQGCSSLEDDDETNSIADLINQPEKIVPSLVSSGPGFWILIIIVLLISGTVTYFIIRADKNKLR
jgi:hypothetical protein